MISELAPDALEAAKVHLGKTLKPLKLYDSILKLSFKYDGPSCLTIHDTYMTIHDTIQLQSGIIWNRVYESFKNCTYNQCKSSNFI